jgi:hypothetical protein
MPPVWLLSWRALPQISFVNKTERAGEEREKRKRRGAGEKKGRSGPSKQPPIMARVWRVPKELSSLAKRYTRNWIIFVFYTRFSYVGRAFLLLILLASVTKCMQKPFSERKMAKLFLFSTRLI